MIPQDMHPKARTTILSALTLLATSCLVSADEADARAILATMSDYMTGLQTFAFEYDATLEIVTTEDQKIGLAASGTASIERPGILHATRKGGFADMELAYDGHTLTVIGHETNVYTQIEFDGTIDSMIDNLRETHGVVLPAADLLMADPAKILLQGVTDVKDLGSGVMGGLECDHIALRNDELDLQIWVAQGESPYPCRYVIAARNVPHQPQYTVQISRWTTAVAAKDLSVGIPDGATRVEAAALAELSQELPETFTIGENQ